MNRQQLNSDLLSIKSTISRWLHIEDISVVDVVLAALIANKLKGDPLWLLLIAASSSAKTELLRSLEGHSFAYFLSSLTSSTLVSGMKTKKDMPCPSLLPHLNGKTLIIKDFTTVLSMRHETRTEILAQLREVFDGKFSKAFGTGQQFEWSGKVGLIAACTPVWDKFHGVISSMGDRFLIYRAQNGNSVISGRAAIRAVGHEQEMRGQIQRVVHQFLDNIFQNIDSFCPNVTETENLKLINIAAFSGMGRCPVERDGFDKAVLYQPEVEGPGRLVKQLYQMATAVMLIHGKDKMDDEVFVVVQKIGRDLLPVSRLRILEYLWKKRAWETAALTQTTGDIAIAVNMPTNTVKTILEDLMVAGALNRQKQETSETAPYLWQLKRIMFEYITNSGVFDSLL